MATPSGPRELRSRAVTWITSLPKRRQADSPVAWLVSLADPSTAALQALPPNASDIEDGRHRIGVDRRRFLARRALVRVLIAGGTGADPNTVTVRYGEAGQPIVQAPDPALFCSVSARGDVAGLAVSTRPVGIDLEVIQEGAIPWAVLSAQEAGHLKSIPEAARMRAFLQIWTLKEAYLKAIGTGLNRDPTTVAIELSANGPTILDGGPRRQLRSSALRQISLEGQPIIAACIEDE